MAGTPPEWAPRGIDTTRPSAARIQDALLGGKDNFASDRMVVERMRQIMPHIADLVVLGRQMLARIVRFMVERGIDQFLDLGAGLPAEENTHQLAPRARVVYVDMDPLVEPHIKLLLQGNKNAAAITADVRKVELVLDHPATRRLIDFSRPVGVLMMGLLYNIPDADDPWGLVRRYMAAVPSGSYLAAGDPYMSGEPVAADLEGGLRLMASAGFLRDRAAILRYFDGLDLVEPGLVPVPHWPVAEGPLEPWQRVIVCGVAVKP